MTRSDLSRAMEAMQQGDPEKAAAVCGHAIAAGDEDWRLRQLHALALIRSGQSEAALEATAGAKHPRPQDMFRDLGNAFRRAGRADLAERSYRRALAHAPNDADALYGLGLSLAAQKRPAEAEAAHERALKAQPNHAGAMIALGSATSARGDFEAAVRFLDDAVRLKPGSLAARVNRSAVRRRLGDLHGAAEDADAAVRAEPRSADAHLQRANTERARGDREAAEAAFLKAAEIAPARTDILADHAAFLWESGEKHELTRPVDHALARRPSAPLRVLRSRLLLQAGQAEESLAEAQRAVEAAPGGMDELRARAAALSATGAFERAVEDLRRAFDHAPGDWELRLDLAEAFLGAGRFSEAASLIESDPPTRSLQRRCALLATAWRAQGDDRYRRLYDFDAFVGTRMISPPRGYETVAAFNARLADTLRSLHRSQAQPLDQTLFNGTQSQGRLWSSADPVIVALRESLLRAARDFVASLADDASHPFLGRKSMTLRPSGSWSVILRSGGGHVDHFHPGGWISATYYVTVPPNLGEGEGRLTLGGSGVRGVALPPERELPPVPGMAVFFPSYMWHGVSRFQCAPGEARIAAPFDLVPD